MEPSFFPQSRENFVGLLFFQKNEQYQYVIRNSYPSGSGMAAEFVSGHDRRSAARRQKLSAGRN
jgi:hypothetical protein